MSMYIVPAEVENIEAVFILNVVMSTGELVRVLEAPTLVEENKVVTPYVVETKRASIVLPVEGAETAWTVEDVLKLTGTVEVVEGTMVPVIDTVEAVDILTPHTPL